MHRTSPIVTKTNWRTNELREANFWIAVVTRQKHIVSASEARSFIRILWREEPLLYNDREISKYTRAISRQRLGKYVPAATDMHAKTEVLDTVFPTRSVQGLIRKTTGATKSVLWGRLWRKVTVWRKPPYRERLRAEAEKYPLSKPLPENGWWHSRLEKA
jgi:hypothetical protein